MKTAIITGITGMDAANLAKHLLNMGYRVVGTERRSSTPRRWRLEELGILNHENLIITHADLLDQGSLDRVVKEFQPDEVYNLAAQSFVGASWQTPVATSDVTGLGATRVFEAVRNNKPNARIYQAGSSEMFGGENRVEILNENSDFYPRSPYGVAKVYAHNMAINYRESYNMFVCNGILFNHEGPLRGLEFVTRKVTDAVARISAGLQTHVELLGLDSHRDWGDSRDFVEAMHLMLQKDSPEDFVIATNISNSISDLLKVAFERIGVINWKDHVKIIGKQRPADVKYLRGDYSKAKEFLNWEPIISFEKMIREMVDADIERVSKEQQRA